MKFLLSILLLVFALPSNRALAESAPKIVAILPLSGGAQLAGEQARAGIEKANLPGVKLIFEDDACASKSALAIYRKSSDIDKVKFFLGPCCSSPMKTVAPYFAKNGQIAMGACGLSESVLASANGHLFSPFYTIESEDKFLANSIRAMGIKKIAIVFWDNDFSRAHEAGFRKSFRGEAISFPFVDFNVASIRDIILKLKSQQFEAVYVPLVEPLILGFMKELQQQGLRGLKVFSIYGAQMPDVVTANGPAADGLIYSHPKIPLGEDALPYFARMGAELLTNAILSCNGDSACVQATLRDSKKFDGHGALRHDIELRTIKNGKFVKLEEAAYNKSRDTQAGLRVD